MYLVLHLLQDQYSALGDFGGFGSQVCPNNGTLSHVCIMCIEANSVCPSRPTSSQLAVCLDASALPPPQAAAYSSQLPRFEGLSSSPSQSTACGAGARSPATTVLSDFPGGHAAPCKCAASRRAWRSPVPVLFTQ